MTEIEIRYEEAPEHAYELMKLIIDKMFLELVNAKILILMDTKQRMADGGAKITLGRMSKTNDLTRHLTIDESGSETGYDYIMYLDKQMWDHVDDKDRSCVIRHELRHTLIDDEAKAPYKLRAHTIEDFHEEVKLNEKDPRWRERVAAVTESRYESLKNPQQKLPI